MRRSRKSGQTMVEYAIIVGILAIAALAIFGVFSDRIRAMMGGATRELGGDETAVNTAVDTGSKDWLKSLKKEGAPDSGN
jgi:type IV pilus assembly protein PilA